MGTNKGYIKYANMKEKWQNKEAQGEKYDE